MEDREEEGIFALFSMDEITETQRKEGLSPVGRLRGIMKGSRGVKVGRTRRGKGLNKSPLLYQRLENPGRCNPTIKTLEKVAHAFGKHLSIEFA